MQTRVTRLLLIVLCQEKTCVVAVYRLPSVIMGLDCDHSCKRHEIFMTFV